MSILVLAAGALTAAAIAGAKDVDVRDFGAKGAYDKEKPNGSWFTATMTRTPKIRFWKTAKGADPHPKLFESVGTTPEMKGLARAEGAAYLTYGPLLLAKSSLLGTSREDVFATKGVIDGGWSCSLKPLKAEGVNRAWTATFAKGAESFSVPVCDFASCDIDDPTVAFQSGSNSIGDPVSRV